VRLSLVADVAEAYAPPPPPLPLPGAGGAAAHQHHPGAGAMFGAASFASREVQEQTKEWEESRKSLQLTGWFCVRVLLYQGRDLPQSEEGGSVNPFVRVSLAGKSADSGVRQATVAPAWYETLALQPIELPVEQGALHQVNKAYAPQLHIELYNKST
jgi:hypothetical protein